MVDCQKSGNILYCKESILFHNSSARNGEKNHLSIPRSRNQTSPTEGCCGDVGGGDRSGERIKRMQTSPSFDGSFFLVINVALPGGSDPRRKALKGTAGRTDGLHQIQIVNGDRDRPTAPRGAEYH